MSYSSEPIAYKLSGEPIFLNRDTGKVFQKDQEDFIALVDSIYKKVKSNSSPELEESKRLFKFLSATALARLKIKGKYRELISSAYAQFNREDKFAFDEVIKRYERKAKETKLKPKPIPHVVQQPQVREYVLSPAIQERAPQPPPNVVSRVGTCLDQISNILRKEIQEKGTYHNFGALYFYLDKISNLAGQIANEPALLKPQYDEPPQAFGPAPFVPQGNEPPQASGPAKSSNE